jgi:hypothetical protein
VPLAAALLLAMLSGCASSTFDVLPQKMGGLPADAPERPAERRAFPNVYEVRPTRETTPLSEAEQKKLESDLTTLREEQKQRANPPSPPPKAAAPAPKKGPAKVATPAKKKQKDPVVPEQKGPVAAPKMVN